MWRTELKTFRFRCLCTELLRLHQNPRISAECDKHVTLNCDVASSREGLSIKRMQWSLNGTSLCSVEENGDMTTHPVHTMGGFHCEYIHGQLSLVLHKVQPRQTVNSKYTCKMHCNRGVQHMNTAVELQGQSQLFSSSFRECHEQRRLSCLLFFKHFSAIKLCALSITLRQKNTRRPWSNSPLAIYVPKGIFRIKIWQWFLLTFTVATSCYIVKHY